MRLVVIRTLRQAGYEGQAISEACSGKEAFDLLERDSFDMILSDWNMPDMTGIELLNAIRAKGRTVTFGFVTSEGTPPMREEARQAGANFYVTKPFTADSLGRAMRGLETGHG